MRRLLVPVHWFIKSWKNNFPKQIETGRCPSLDVFPFYFAHILITTCYKILEDELLRYRSSYEKTDKYFRSVGNLNHELIQTLTLLDR